MGVNNYQTILGIELNDQMCYSEHHLMVPEHFYCWVAGSFNSVKCLGVINETNVQCFFAFPDIFPPLFATGTLHSLFLSQL